MNNSTNQTDIFGNVTSFSNIPNSGVNPNINTNEQGSNIQNQPYIQPMNSQIQQNNQILQNSQIQQNNQLLQNNQVQPNQNAYVNQNTQTVYQNSGMNLQASNTQVQDTQNYNMSNQSVNKMTPNSSVNSQPVNNSFVNMETTVDSNINTNEQVAQSNESFTEMPFAGVNKLEEEEKKVTVLNNTQTTPTNSKADPIIETPANPNMEPIEKKTDENSGLKFLAVIFIILIIVILCLPLIGLN